MGALTCHRTMFILNVPSAGGWRIAPLICAGYVGGVEMPGNNSSQRDNEGLAWFVFGLAFLANLPWLFKHIFEVIT